MTVYRRGKCKKKLHRLKRFFGGAVCECRIVMSHHSDEQGLMTVTSDSFWEPGNYKRTTRRIDDGHRLCGELQALVQERADIEKAYAKSLRGWSKKWNDLIEKGPEYGTMEAAWKASLVEADRLCELHLRVRDSLVNDVITMIKNWQKDTYHKSMIQLKERKEMDEAFKKAQKPWAKLLQKVERTRLEYHTACKQERTAQNQERNASGDTSFSPDQVKKMAERVAKCKEDVAKNREKYQAALAEITGYNSRYIDDMTAVFERCQQMEAQRLMFFKDIMFLIHKSLNISQDPTLPQIYEEFHHTVNNADNQKDLKWWAKSHGVDMPMAWPQFEEYTEEFREIAKGKMKESLPTAPITLLNQRPVSEDELPPITNSNTKTLPKATNHTTESSRTVTDNATASNGTTNTIDKKTISAPITVTNGTASAPKSNKSSPAKESGKQDNPFEEEEWEDDESGALHDSGEPGVPVRALYDYTGAESDELSFRQGDLFEKLEDEDEQGWCKGRKDGRVGLYPANYVEPVGH